MWPHPGHLAAAGSIQVLLPSQVPDQGLAAGCYALIVGKLKGQGAGIHINAHKVGCGRCRRCLLRAYLLAACMQPLEAS